MSYSRTIVLISTIQISLWKTGKQVLFMRYFLYEYSYTDTRTVYICTVLAVRVLSTSRYCRTGLCVLVRRTVKLPLLIVRVAYSVLSTEYLLTRTVLILLVAAAPVVRYIMSTSTVHCTVETSVVIVPYLYGTSYYSIYTYFLGPSPPFFYSI